MSTALKPSVHTNVWHASVTSTTNGNHRDSESHRWASHVEGRKILQIWCPVNRVVSILQSPMPHIQNKSMCDTHFRCGNGIWCDQSCPNPTVNCGSQTHRRSPFLRIGKISQSNSNCSYVVAEYEQALGWPDLADQEWWSDYIGLICQRAWQGYLKWCLALHLWGPPKFWSVTTVEMWQQPTAWTIGLWQGCGDTTLGACPQEKSMATQASHYWRPYIKIWLPTRCTDPIYK